MADCIFCKIVRGEVPADIVHKNELVTAFRDVSPQAPVHALVVPNQHVGSVGEIGPGNGALVAALIVAANPVAAQEGVAESGYRLVFNMGADAGRSVDHLHLHVLGGRKLSWPPG